MILHYFAVQVYTPSERCSGGLDGDSQTTALVRAAHIGHAGVVRSLLTAGVTRPSGIGFEVLFIESLVLQVILGFTL